MIGQFIGAGALLAASLYFAKLGSDQTLEAWYTRSEANLGRRLARIFAGLAITAAFGAGLLL